MSTNRPARPGAPAPRPSLSGAPARIEGGGPNPFAPEPAAPPPDEGKGAAGRTLRRGGAAAAPAAPEAGRYEPGAPAPFATYGPDSYVIGGAGEGSRSQSMGIIAIVGGLVFMVGAVLVITVVVLLVGFFVFDVGRGDKVADNDKVKDKHIRDTGFAEVIDKPDGGQGGPAGPGDPGDRTISDPNAGPPPGPATLIVPDKMMWLSIEVNCPGGFRGRGKFRPHSAGWMKATAYNVPGDERCVVTFQGSEPAKTYVTGNQTLQCTFNPTNCVQM